MNFDTDALAAAIREIDGKHKIGAGQLAEKLVEAPPLKSLLDEVERTRASEVNFLKHGHYLTFALKQITEYVKNHPETDISKEISSIMEDMWVDIATKSPGRAESLWGRLTRSEQEEYRDLHYDPIGGNEERSIQLEELARMRQAEWEAKNA
jgi:hypothetical protein